MDFKVVGHFAEEIVTKAGKLQQDFGDKIEIAAHKDREDVVTNADLACEELIISAIEKQYPEHNLISEERGRIDKNSKYTWVIDPLDGTKQYVCGIPLYCPALVLQENGEDILAAIYQPTSNQLFSAIKGGGALLNGKRIQVSPQINLGNSFICAHPPFFDGKMVKEHDLAWYKIAQLSKHTYRVRALPNINLGLCWLGMGGWDGFINLLNVPKSWDVEPGLFIAKEAGAKATDLAGQPLTNNFKNGIIVSNGKIHQELLEVLNGS